VLGCSVVACVTDVTMSTEPDEPPLVAAVLGLVCGASPFGSTVGFASVGPCGPTVSGLDWNDACTDATCWTTAWAICCSAVVFAVSTTTGAMLTPGAGGVTSTLMSGLVIVAMRLESVFE
jgi:hypothetical protein